MNATMHGRVVRAWLARLAISCAGETPLADQQRKVDLLAEDLALDFPDSAAFTNDSCRAVAGAVDEFPSYGKLKAFLGAWWEQNRPATPAGEPDDIDATDLPVGDKIFVRRWLSGSHLSGNRAAIGDWLAKPWPGGVVGAAVDGQVPALVVDLSLIRRHAPAGYRRLLRTNQQAAQIAGKMGWTDIEHRRGEPSADEQAAVAALVAKITGQIRPTGEPAKPNQAHNAAGLRFAELVAKERGRRLGAVDPKTLDALWAANDKLARPQRPPDPPEPPLPEAAE
jgi:hypothetical protein